ncbi:MAG: competence protein TfoX [Ideonella sp. MAG2]|nr:MAG: competence protein TfoX [Ideonella sp. MAG2]
MKTPPPNAELLAWALELLSPLGAVRSRRMFGGHGIYVDELFIALILNDQLYLKADEHNEARFVAAACSRFEYTMADGRQGHLRYYTVPAEALESVAEMQPWAREAMASALRARASKPAAKPRTRAANAPKPAAKKRLPKP